VKHLPKVELHLHLEGAMRSQTVRELSVERMGWSGPLDEGWERAYYTYTDFGGFMQQLTPRFPAEPAEYARIAAECFEDLAAQNVAYAEVSFDVPVREVGQEGRFWPIMEALEEARRQAEARWPIRLNYIAAIQRSLPLDVGIRRVELAAQARDRGIGVVAIDLHGDEAGFPPAPFAPAFRLAADYGLGLRAHAGEAAGIDVIWDTINVLDVRRIAHGVRAPEDPALIERLMEGDITLELCPTSNVRTAAVRDLRSHPFPQLYSVGIPVTVNSDDPLPFFTDIGREYRLLVDEFGLSCDDLRKITVYAIQAAFLPETERAALIAMIEPAYESAGRPVTEPLPPRWPQTPVA
jgi:adenosine deaminase